MAYNQKRTSTMSSSSNIPRQQGTPQNHQVSTQTLLNALHNAYLNHQPHSLESSTSLVVNTWATALQMGPDGLTGGTVDKELAERAWQHARRRAEDGSIVLGSLHQSSPSMLVPFVSNLPLQIPAAFFNTLQVIRAFTHCVTPQNPSFPRYSSLAAKFTLSQEGGLLGSSFALSTSGLDIQNGLLKVPAESGYRAFDVFYYLNVSSASKAEREVLDLKPSSAYTLLRRSGTFNPPNYLPTADDTAAAEDFRQHLRAIGIKGAALQNLISSLAGILKLGNTCDYLIDSDVLDTVCEDAAMLLDLDTSVLRHKCSTEDRLIFIGGLYEAILDWVIRKANSSIAEEMKASKRVGSDGGSRPGTAIDDMDEDTVCITVIDIPDPNLGKAVSLQTVFDDTQGINSEMKEDGVSVTPAGTTVLNEMRNAIAAVAPDLGDFDNALGRERELENDRRQGVLEKVAQLADPESYMKAVLHPVQGQGVVLGSADLGGRFDLSATLNSSRVWFHLSIHPTDDSPAMIKNILNPWSAAAVSSQLRAWRLPEWANRRNRHLDFTADFDTPELVERYSSLGCQDGRDGIETWLLERGWTNGEVVIGENRIWMRESTWWEAECLKDNQPDLSGATTPIPTGFSAVTPGMESGYFTDILPNSQTNLLNTGSPNASGTLAPSASGAPTRQFSAGDYGLGNRGDQYKGDISYEGQDDPELASGRVLESKPISPGRRIWVAFVWALTFWIPSFVLRFVGRMKRPDVRLAWREKITLCFIIFLFNGVVIFYIIFFGRLLCPNFDKAWDPKEVGYHQGETDFYVSHRGKVYDLTKFWKIQHSDTNIPVDSATMLSLAGTNVDEYINPPLTIACPHLVTDVHTLLTANTTAPYANAIHTSGPTFQTDKSSALYNIDWYTSTFLPKMQTMYKGALVYDKSYIYQQGQAGFHDWVIIDNSVYDLTDYFFSRNTIDQNVAAYRFFPSWFENLVLSNLGQDISSAFAASNTTYSRESTMECLNNYFYVGQTDFRKTARCQVNNYMLLAFTILLCTVIGVKFLAALQLESKRRPSQQDKFVICQVPAYTEGEDQLRKGLDSLTALAYDNKRKLICVICDGVIVGAGNDRPTPKIVLDILGVDPKTDPPALPFKSVGQGSEQLNYGKVYSGLYEFEGNVVPYIVIVKVGKESEQNKPKPGNRGKRDSQILLMSFLNRVHHRSPMSPLELEIFHQINNVIGVDPELYEYLFMVDADTMVREDSLNRLVAACANDAKIAGICGETSLQNEERSWWTMIQVYEYYISHHLAKAFESLFGSVTCLPGCFCMYRIRTVDKGKPLIISDLVISEYSDGDVDTLHKKNLLALGEDRYLTTLMTKHFPHMSYKFVPSALALTAAPDEWSVLLSQRRRWINSTVHNLAELIFLKDMCGFCCFSMRFVVMIDLFGTLILPATCGYLVYLLYEVGSKSGQFPLISLIMLAAVYGLQAIIFIIKRQWQHIGWMVIYILAFPIYSFILPIYSFWKQDDFSWGSTRLVLEEKGRTKVVAMDKDEGFDPRSIPLMKWDDWAAANGLPGRRGMPGEKYDAMANMPVGYEDQMELDDIRSVVSSVKPGSGIFGASVLPQMQNSMMKQSLYSLGGPAPPASFAQGHVRQMSLGGISTLDRRSPTPTRPMSTVYPVHSVSTDNLVALNIRSRSAMSGAISSSRPASTLNLLGDGPGSIVNLPGPVNFMEAPRPGPTDEQIMLAVRESLAEVDLERVTKKQLVSLAELKLQCQVQGERKQFLNATIDAELERMPE